MRIDIITVLPEMIEGFFNCSIMKRAQNKGLAEIHIHNLRDYTEDKYRRVDDYPFGGFAGMVMKIEPIERCINALKAERDYDEVIFTTPDGEQFNQPMANSLSLAQNLIILCGHFKGIDFRIREHLITKEISVDDYPFGGFAGMVMKIEPIERCINALKAERDYDEVIFTTPDGEQFNQPMANSLSLAQNLIILCGHFKGIDFRIREHLITKEISIGDYVLTGGELAAAVMADAIVRIIPGVISDEQSALSDSFQDNLLAAPVYTRPADYNGWKVPDILLSGHEAKIKEWELQQSLERTKRLRPDLLEE